MWYPRKLGSNRAHVARSQLRDLATQAEARSGPGSVLLGVTRSGQGQILEMVGGLSQS